MAARQMIHSRTSFDCLTRRKLKPNVKMCLNEMMEVVGEQSREDVVDQVLDYLLSGPNEDITLQKLRERQLVPKVMDEFETAAILD